MKTKVLFLLAVFATASMNIFAQTLTPQQNSKSKWGYENEEGKAVIKYKYYAAQKFSEGLAAVATESVPAGLLKDSYLWEYIDKTGKVIIKSEKGKNPLKYKFTEAEPFSNGLAKVAIKYSSGAYWSIRWGYIDKTGKEIIPIKYFEIGDFSADGLAKVSDGYNYGFVDKTGKEIIPVQYTKIGDFSADGFVKVEKDNKLGVLDKTGKEIIPIKYFKIGDFSAEGLAKVREGHNYGFVDKTGKEVIPIKYYDAGDFSDGLAKVEGRGKRDDAWGFIDKTGKEVIPFKYIQANDFSNGYAAVTAWYNDDEHWQVIDKTGKEVLPDKYSKQEVLKMLSDLALLKKEIQGIQKQDEHLTKLVEKAEAALDNDYYTADWDAEEALSNLIKELDGLEESKKNQHIMELQTALNNAISIQKMTKKYGATIAKKILTGKYEIGMTKEMVKDALMEQRTSKGGAVALFPFYKKSESTSSESWRFDWTLFYNQTNITPEQMTAAGIDCPILVFKNGKLTDIFR